MSDVAATDPAVHMAALIEHTDVAERDHGAEATFQAFGLLLKRVCLRWPIAAVPPAAALRLYHAMGQALPIDDALTVVPPRQVKQ